jgi:hypothetical protein
MEKHGTPVALLVVDCSGVARGSMKRRISEWLYVLGSPLTQKTAASVFAWRCNLLQLLKWTEAEKYPN